MRTVACEGRAFVVSANQCVRRDELPGWITGSSSAGEASATANANATRVAGERKHSVTAEGPHEIVWPDSHQPPTVQPNNIQEKEKEKADFVSRGGSCIISPQGTVLAGPIWEVCTEDAPDAQHAAAAAATATGDGLIFSEIDIQDCERGRLDLDVAGSYSRGDAFKLSVEGLDLDPPPM